MESAETLALLSFLVIMLASLPMIYSFSKKEEHFEQMLAKPEKP